MHLTKEARVRKLVKEEFEGRALNYYEFKERCLQFFHTISKEYEHDDLAALETYMKGIRCRGAYPIMTADGQYSHPPKKHKKAAT